MELLRSRTRVGMRYSKMTSRGIWLGFLVSTLPNISHAEPLTEIKSLQLGFNQTDFVNQLESRVNSAQGALVTTKTWSNPEFEFTREDIGDTTEYNLWLRQRFDVSGRRAYRRDAAQAHIDMIEASNDGRRVRLGATIQKRFFRTLYFQQQQQLLGRWIEKFSKVEVAMRKREEAGDVSGYDRRRISREKVSLLAQQRHHLASYQSVWQQLLGIIGALDNHDYQGVQGDLFPPELPPMSTMLEDLSQQPQLMQLQHEAEAARLAIRAAERSKIPEITLGIGHKNLDGPVLNENGLMLTASIPVPVLDRKQGARLSAESNAREVESEYQLLLNQMTAEVKGLWQQAKKLAENAQLFRRQSVNASFELVRIAETAYQSNEIGVLELIDAYHSALEAETTALQLALEARLTRIELDKLYKGASL